MEIHKFRLQENGSDSLSIQLDSAEENDFVEAEAAAVGSNPRRNKILGRVAPRVGSKDLSIPAIDARGYHVPLGRQGGENIGGSFRIVESQRGRAVGAQDIRYGIQVAEPALLEVIQVVDQEGGASQ